MKSHPSRGGALRLGGALIVLALVAAACGSDEDSGSGTVSLPGTGWSATEIADAPDLAGASAPTLFFEEENSMNGSTGCNQYSGSYTVDADSLGLSVGPMTLVACPPPQDEIETAWLAAMTATDTFSADAETLTLFDDGGAEVATLAAISSDLAGTSWTVIAYNNGNEAVVSVIIETEGMLTADFDSEGTLSGSGGCNSYNGSYSTDGDAIEIGPIASTERACLDPEGVMEQESLYLAALATAATYAVRGETMEMRTDDGALVANFARS
jgi:heat shock protein HslJ